MVLVLCGVVRSRKKDANVVNVGTNLRKKSAWLPIKCVEICRELGNMLYFCRDFDVICLTDLVLRAYLISSPLTLLEPSKIISLL